ncbi:hypothetical protein BOX15_Mlig031210g1 [Macrostomum lignano]|uniref:Annexin n=2 Tax=Macrostomum lignano TaxID=282301 RepID=A0A1I8JGD2_9PLAT|nr:hypothetical protein BOX15_Mlig031210g1 [Macrostomum lignano]
MAVSKVDQPFNALAEAERLHKAMKGIGTNENLIIDVLGHRPSHQRAEIAKAFKTSYGKELDSALKSELSGDFLEVCEGLCYCLSEYDAKCLYSAVKGAGTDEEAIIDILSSRNNAQIQAIKASYSKVLHRDLEADIKSDVSGNFGRVLVGILTANRDENPNVDPNLVAQDVEALFQAGEKKLGTNESTFNRVMCSRSYPHIAAVASEYAKRHKKNLLDVIDSETSGSYCSLLRSIVSYAIDPAAHVAELFYKSMKGLGTNDRRLQRTVISQCESDLPAVKAAFQRLHNKSLAEMVRGDTSGDYRKILLALLGEA